MSTPKAEQAQTQEAADWLRRAAAARKCWCCGCLHGSLPAIDQAFKKDSPPADLHEAIQEARARLTAAQYDCLGCDVCYPAAAVNALALEGDICPSEAVEPREGWPPLPGSFTVVRYRAPVAVCTLTDDDLAETVVGRAGSEVAIVGTVQTENLGIERILCNVLADPNIRFLIVCGADSRGGVGHLPGESLVALGRNGVDAGGRIVGAHGKRPFLRNLDAPAVEHFRRTVEVVDLVGVSDVEQIVQAVRACTGRYPGPAEPFQADRGVQTVAGRLPPRMVADPAGYFVVYVERSEARLLLEHYTNEGVLDLIIEGRRAAELYTAAIDRGLISRLDHAAYLGRELARAEEALAKGRPYVQDAAPEYCGSAAGACECESSCGGEQ